MYAPSITFWVVGFILNLLFFGLGSYWVWNQVRKPDALAKEEKSTRITKP